MGIRSFLKKYLPSYRTERRMMEEMEKLREQVAALTEENTLLQQDLLFFCHVADHIGKRRIIYMTHIRESDTRL